MNQQILLRVVCPECGVSVMDSDHLIEGLPSVKVDMEAEGEKGWLRASSLYGSYALETEFVVDDGVIVKLSCPECNAELLTRFACDECSAPIARLALRGGGVVAFCTREGCRRHFLACEDVAPAGSDRGDIEGWSLPTFHAIRRRSVATAQKEIIAKGTFLSSYCPHCQVSLIDAQGITFHVVTVDGEKGRLTLSPYLDVFTHESTIDISARIEVADLLCPHCEHSLVDPDQECAECGSRTAMITVSAMRKLISFYICLREGCQWHGISWRDTRLIRLEDSVDW